MTPPTEVFCSTCDQPAHLCRECGSLQVHSGDKRLLLCLNCGEVEKFERRSNLTDAMFEAAAKEAIAWEEQHGEVPPVGVPGRSADSEDLTMTADEIARLRELESKATPGPWEVHAAKAGECRSGDGLYVDAYANGPDPLTVAFASSARHADAAFIAAARSAFPTLLDALTSSQAREARYREALVKVRKHVNAYFTAKRWDDGSPLYDHDGEHLFAGQALAMVQTIDAALSPPPDDKEPK